MWQGGTGWTDWFGMPGRSSPLQLSIYLGMEARAGKGRRIKRRKGMWGDSLVLPSTRKGSRAWAASPNRQPFLTLHKHRQPCAGWQLSHCRQHLSVCGLKDWMAPWGICLYLPGGDHCQCKKHMYFSLHKLSPLFDFTCSGVFGL